MSEENVNMEAPPSTAPVAEAKEKVKKTKYPVPNDGLAEWPADFDEKVHQPLKVVDFKDPIVFLDHKAAGYEARAKAIRAEIEEIKIAGPGGVKKANKLLKVTAELDALKELLKAQGMDVEALLAQRANA